MPFPTIFNCNLKLNGAQEECSEEGSPTPYSFSGSVFTRKLLTWCNVQWSKQNTFFTKLRSNLDRFGVIGNNKEVSWEDLPVELWGEIGRRQSNWVDILLFRSICNKWRSSLPLPTRFPLRVPPLPEAGPICDVITEVSIYRTVPLPQLLLSQEVGGGDNFRKDFVLRGRAIQDLRSEYNSFYVSMLAPWEAEPHCRLTFACKGYRLRRAAAADDIISNHEYVEKIVILSSNADDHRYGGVNFYYASFEDLTVVALLSDGKLALLRLGGLPVNWVWDTDFCDQVFQDITVYRGRLCAIDYSDDVVVMDCNSLLMTPLSTTTTTTNKAFRRKYLFEDRGNLFYSSMDELYEDLLLPFKETRLVADSVLAIMPFLVTTAKVR